MVSLFTAVSMPPLLRMAPDVARPGTARQSGPRRHPQPDVEQDEGSVGFDCGSEEENATGRRCEQRQRGAS